MKLIVVCCLFIIALAVTNGEQEPRFCEKNGVTIEEGETYQVDACQSCLCENGSLQCDWIQCGWPECPDEAWPITKEGDCCPSCSE